MQRAFKPGLDDIDQEIANCVLDDMRNYADAVGRPHETYAACGTKIGVDPGILRNRLVRNQTRWSYAEIALLMEKGILSSRTVSLLKSLVDVPEMDLEPTRSRRRATSPSTCPEAPRRLSSRPPRGWSSDAFASRPRRSGASGTPWNRSSTTQPLTHAKEHRHGDRQ